MADDEFVQLLLENSQLAMQGHSKRTKKSCSPTVFHSHTGKAQEKESRETVIPKLGQLEETGSVVNAISSPGPSEHTGLNVQDDDIVPWINYPTEDSLHYDYCSEFLNEFPSADLSSLSTRSDAVLDDRGNCSGRAARDSCDVEISLALKEIAGGSETSKIRTTQLFQLSQQCESSVPSSKPGAGSIGGINRRKVHQNLCEALLNARSREHNVPDPELTLPPPPSNSGLSMMNFTHFLKPVALAKGNLQSVTTSRNSKKAFSATNSNPMEYKASVESVAKLRSSEKASAASSSNAVESTFVESTSCLKSVPTIRSRSSLVLSMAELKSPASPLQEVVSVEQPEAICQEDTSEKNCIDNTITHSCSHLTDHIKTSSLSARVALEMHEIQPEGIVASSTACTDSASNDPKHGEKRQNHEEVSEYYSEDLEDDFLSLKKSATERGSNSKRNRTAEVHNLSERRRRDRINDKMRALQKLIPNCNKVDKPSMLDEAIEYIKTLQMQLQMMSTQSGILMSPRMLPSGMQTMSHLSPLNVGTGSGIGLGYGMGMYDINGLPRFNLIPVHPLNESQFPRPSIPVAPGLQGMPAPTSLQVFGIPRQGIPASMSLPALFVSSPGSSFKANSVLYASRIMTSLASSSSSKVEQPQNINLDIAHKKVTNDSLIQRSTQPVKECFGTPATQMGNKALQDNRKEALNSITDNEISSTRTTSYN